MINYDSIIKILQSDNYIDKTDCFEPFLGGYKSRGFDNCKHTGASLFLKTLACFLDKDIDTNDIFKNLKIAQSKLFEKEINTYEVLYLDFSDFNAATFEDAIEYLTVKLSDLYKYHFKKFGTKKGSIFYSLNKENILNMIEGKPGDWIKKSFSCLVTQLRGYVGDIADNDKLAILIDNFIQLEAVACKNGYHWSMRNFLNEFVIENVYKYCDLVLITGDYQREEFDVNFHETFYEITSDNHISDQAYRYFCIHPIDLKVEHPEMVVPLESQFHFDYQPFFLPEFDWVTLICEERKKIEEEKQAKEQALLRSVMAEKSSYAIDLSPEVPRVSSNLGIRHKKLDKTSGNYLKLNALLKEIYIHIVPNFKDYDVYKYFQKVEDNKYVIRNREEFVETLDSLIDGNPNWRHSHANGSGYWVSITYKRVGEEHGSPANIYNIKVYACFQHTDIEDIFVNSLKYLLQKCDNDFAAKITTVERSDQMCYWLSKSDFKYLEEFYKPFFSDMKQSLPFIAYKGELGISKDFPYRDDSHNAVQARIIADYFKTITNADSIDLEDMYNNYISKWNADLPEESDEFKYQSALSFVVILDTLDCILGKNEITDDSLMLNGDDSFWEMLSDSMCWADVNRRYAKNLDSGKR